MAEKKFSYIGGIKNPTDKHIATEIERNGLFAGWEYLYFLQPLQVETSEIERLEKLGAIVERVELSQWIRDCYKNENDGDGCEPCKLAITLSVGGCIHLIVTSQDIENNPGEALGALIEARIESQKKSKARES